MPAYHDDASHRTSQSVHVTRQTRRYRYAIAWIGLNDDPASRDPGEIAEQISTLLVADLFDVPADLVAEDIITYRVQENA